MTPLCSSAWPPKRAVAEGARDGTFAGPVPYRRRPRPRTPESKAGTGKGDAGGGGEGGQQLGLSLYTRTRQVRGMLGRREGLLARVHL
jgi:hypothetical protein